MEIIIDKNKFNKNVTENKILNYFMRKVHKNLKKNINSLIIKDWVP